MVKISETKTGVVKMDLSVFITGLAMFSMLLVAVNALPTGELKPMMPGFFNLSGMPDECKNPDKGYCTKPYDQHIMLRIEKLLTSDKPMLGDLHGSFNDRQGIANNEQTDCIKTSHQDPIYEIYDENDNVRAVVQSEKHLMQIVTIERCENPGRLMHSTRHFDIHVLLKKHVTCKQKTMSYSFLALSLDGNKLEMVKSKKDIPVHCACLLMPQEH